MSHVQFRPVKKLVHAFPVVAVIDRVSRRDHGKACFIFSERRKPGADQITGNERPDTIVDDHLILFGSRPRHAEFQPAQDRFLADRTGLCKTDQFRVFAFQLVLQLLPPLRSHDYDDSLYGLRLLKGIERILQDHFVFHSVILFGEIPHMHTGADPAR